jgi:putative tryptophan/tyrosine transport system substrate-binding protein
MRWFEQIAPSFRQGLVEGGYSGGRTATIEGRYAEGHFERLPTLAADLLNQQVALVATVSLPAALATKAATTKIPIVFVVGEDPVEVGLVDKLNRPGGNITGISNFANVLAAKRLELLRELVPDGTQFGLLVNPNNPNAEPDAQVVRAAAEALGIKLLVVKAGSESEIDPAFATLVERRTRALCVNVDPLFTDHADQIVALAIRNRLPVIYPRREFVIAGGLVSYDSSFTDSFRQAGIYAGRILNGEKPADLPVQQTTRIELTVNLRTARALGLTIPLSLLARADEVIE